MPAQDQGSEQSGGRPLRKQGEEAIGRLAQDLLQSPVVSGTLTAVFETRERATRAQEVAMSALNLPSAADIERLTRRVRSVAQRIEGVEDTLDRLTDKLERLGAVSALEDRLGAIEGALERIEVQLRDVAEATPETRAGQPSGTDPAPGGSTAASEPPAGTTGGDVAETIPPVSTDTDTDTATDTDTDTATDTDAAS